jgi:hydroxylaminobenzene mutase
MLHDAKRHLVRHGLILFLLGLVVGFAVQSFANPRSGLSAHLEGVMNGTFLIALGAAWSEIRLPRRAAIATVALATYGAYANMVGTTLSAVFGTSEATPLAGAGHHGAPLHETLVSALLVSVGLSMVVALGLALWGALRAAPAPSAS